MQVLAMSLRTRSLRHPRCKSLQTGKSLALGSILVAIVVCVLPRLSLALGFSQLARRTSIGAVVVAAAPAARAEDRPTPPPAVTMLRVAEVTAVQEKLLRRVAAGKADGLRISRDQMAMSTGILMRNSKLAPQLLKVVEELLPVSSRANGDAHATKCLLLLDKIGQNGVTEKGNLSDAEVLQLADMYASAREELRFVFDLLSSDIQDQTRAIMREIREAERIATQEP